MDLNHPRQLPTSLEIRRLIEERNLLVAMVLILTAIMVILCMKIGSVRVDLDEMTLQKEMMRQNARDMYVQSMQNYTQMYNMIVECQNAKQ